MNCDLLQTLPGIVARSSLLCHQLSAHKLRVATAGSRRLTVKAERGGEETSSERRRSGSSNYRRNGGQARSPKGGSYEKQNRRRGRPAILRSPDDTPLRDGNRDRLIGLLTERSAKTLCYYLSETNLHVYHWLAQFMRENPIPRDGAWDDVSGETFLRTLLSMPVDNAKYQTGRDPMFDNIGSIAVDPRQMAQRIMDIRAQVALEMVQDLAGITEENAALLRETLAASLSLDTSTAHPLEGTVSVDEGNGNSTVAE